MNRKRFAILAAIAIATIALAQQPPPSTDTTVPSIGRYQLLATSVPANTASATLPPNVNTVFLLDTQTGKIWRHQSAFPTVNSARQQVINPESFYRVPVAGMP
jgi:hypothetical protein